MSSVQRVGRLTVVGLTPHANPWRMMCRCDCGAFKAISVYALAKATIKSCGCLRDETSSQNHRKHGGRSHHSGITEPVYYVWQQMLRRCYTVSNKAFHNYGGRGITVCDRWRDDFAAFRDDMGPRPDGFTIERIDNNGNYEPGNCRWIPHAAQARNRRNNVVITAHGESKLLTTWAAETGLNRETISGRLDRGWTPEEAVHPERRNRWSRQPRARGA